MHGCTSRVAPLHPVLPHRPRKDHSLARQAVVLCQIISRLNHRVCAVGDDDLVRGYAAAEIGNADPVIVCDLGAVLSEEARRHTP